MHSFYLHVSEPHRLLIRFAGNPHGIPVLFLHGGPGSGCKPEHLAYFDLSRYWVFLMDQRGSGHSTPVEALASNSTLELMADIEALRQQFGIDQWLVFGGSWGSFLGLAYALHYPRHVSGLVLRSVCLGRQQEHDWLYRFGANQLFPQAWRAFQGFIPRSQQQDLLSAYYERAMSQDLSVSWPAVWQWSCWAAACLELPAPLEPETVEQRHRWLSQVRLELHYFYHQLFLPVHFVVDGLSHIHQPVAIVHGARDFLCPVDNAVSLHEQLPWSHLILVPEAGHLSSAPGMFEALCQALNWVDQKIAEATNE